VLKIEIIQNFNAPTPLLCTLEFCYMKFVAFWTVGDAGPYKFVRLFRTRARVFVRLLLKEKPTDAVLSAVDFLILLLRKKAF